MSGVIRSARADLLRLRRWPAVWVTFTTWVALALTFGYVFPYISYRTGTTSFSTEGATTSELLAQVLPPNLPNVMLNGMPLFGGALMMVLGALAAGNGYGWGTWKTVFTQGPSRTSVVAGSLLAVTVFVVAAVLVTVVVDLGASQLIASVESAGVSWPAFPDLLRSIGAGFLVLQTWALLGYTLGTLARGPALSVGLGLVWALVIENLLRGVAGVLGPFEALTKVMPGTSAGSLIGSIVGVSPSGDETPGVLDILTGPQAAGTLLGYLVALSVVTLLLVSRRDVT